MAELKLLYSTDNLNFIKCLRAWIVDFDSENDRNTKQEKSYIEWTWVCWFGSSQWSNLLCSSSYDGSKGLATCKLSCTLLKKVRPEIDDESDNDCEDVVWIFFYVQYYNFIFSVLFSDIIILMIKQADSRIME